jgi:endonuclease YncB( thermonuclease family)
MTTSPTLTYAQYRRLHAVVTFAADGQRWLVQNGMAPPERIDEARRLDVIRVQLVNICRHLEAQS